MYARMEAAFLARPTTGSVRGTRTTPLRDDRAVSLCIKSDLPKTGEMGDEYFSADGTTGWVWMLPTGAKEPSWVDPLIFR
jgi:hypothetical protein